MATKYVSGRVRELKIGISSYSDNKTSLDVKGASVLAGLTTINSTGVNVIGIVTATSFSGSGQFLTDLPGGGLWAQNDTGINTSTNIGVGTTTASSALTVSGDGLITGVITATTFSGNITGVAATFSGTLTYEDVTNVDSVGLITARSGIQFGAAGVGGTIRANGDTTLAGVVTATKYYGDGSELTGVVSGIEVKDDGSSVGTSLTAINFSGATVTTAASGITTVTISSAGFSTAASTISGIVTTLLLSSAQDHKITATGFCTITCSGGSEGDIHSVRIINSGIATVGFSTFFLFPSGNTPVLPTADTSISLISFTVNRVGLGGTQLLAGASLNFS